MESNHQSQLERRLVREIRARLEAERIAEQKTSELYLINQKLEELNRQLEKKYHKKSLELNESEQKFKTLIDTADEFIYEIDSDGNISYANQVALNKLGFHEGELIGSFFIDLIREDYQQLTLKAYTEFKESDDLAASFEIPVLNKDNATIWLSVNAKKIKDKNAQRFSAISRDITKEKEIEHTLEQTKRSLNLKEKKYQELFSNMSLGIVEVDRDLKIVQVNSIFCQMVEYDEEELVGKNPNDVFVAQESLSIIHENHRIRNKGISSNYEVEIITKSQKRKNLIISGTPILDEENEVIGSIGVHYDITDLRQLQKNLLVSKTNAENARIAQSDFLAQMSHEIRTPLNAIIGMAHLLNKTNLTTIQRNYLSTLSEASQILQKLVPDILELNRIESGIIEVKYKCIQIREVVDKMIASFVPTLEDKGLEYLVEIDQEIPECIITDDLYFRQILSNLITNGIKFTDHGSILIKVKKSERRHDTEFLELSVTDTGIGIPDHLTHEIFNKLKTLSQSTRRNIVGSGLGLTITKKLVDALGGEIHVTSEVGSGSTFTVILPYSESKESFQDSPKNVTSVIPDMSDFKALIVEDNALNIQYLSSLFNSWKLNYDLAESSADAVNLTQTESYDMIFMDLQLPDKSGIETARIIQSSPSHSQVPIIAITATPFSAIKNEAKAVGMVSYLTKPFTPHQVMKVLNDLFGDKIRTSNAVANNNEIFSSQLDQKSLLELYEDDYDYATEIFEIFIRDTTPELKKIEEHFEEGKFSLAKAVAHKIKPNFQMVGLSGVKEIIETMESAFQEEDLRSAKSSLEELKSLLSRQIPVVIDQLDHLKKLSKKEIIREST